MKSGNMVCDQPPPAPQVMQLHLANKEKYFLSSLSLFTFLLSYNFLEIISNSARALCINTPA